MTKYAIVWKQRLLRAWGVLSILTIISIATAITADADKQTGLFSIALLIASFLKARQVLDHFLDLRHASGGWHSLFNFVILLILGSCLGLYLMVALRRTL